MEFALTLSFCCLLLLANPAGILCEEPVAERCPSWFKYEYELLQRLFKLEEEQKDLRQKLDDQNNAIQEIKEKYGDYDCPDGWIQHKDSCYYFSPDTKSWSDAKLACQVLGGTLVQVNGSSKDSLLVAIARLANKSLWIGLTDVAKEGTFVWTGTDVILDKGSYSNWFPGQPTNYGGNEHCVHINKDYNFMWNDAPCHNLYNFVCEK